MSSPLTAAFSQLAGDGQSVAEALERGQAAAPLTGHFERLRQDFAGGHLTAVLLGLTSEARTRALSWLYGAEYAVVSVAVVENLGLVEISLSERGFSLEHGGGQRETFDQLDAFLDAIVRTERITHPRTLDWIEPVKLGLTPSSSVRGITLLVPERVEQLLENPALMSRLSTRSNLAILAAPLHHELEDRERSAIEQLTASMDGTWPLMIVDELAEDIEIPRQGWWQQYRPAPVQLPPKLLTTHVLAEMPPLLTSEHEATRVGLFITQQARRLQDAAAALGDMHEQRSRQLGTRARREERRAREQDAAGTAQQERRQHWQTLQQRLAEELPQLGKQLAEVQRKSRSADSELSRQLNQFLDSLSDRDLHKEEGHSSIKLTVSERFLDELRRCAREGLRKQFRQQSDWLRQELDTLRASLNNQAQGLCESAPALPAASLQQDKLWEGVQDLFEVQLRYRGEMPRRGFWDRLKEGRQGAMSFMMIVGLGAMAFGGNIRQNPLFGITLLLIFLGTIVYTFFRWRKDDAERIDKELDRVRDGVSSEVQRLVNDVQRELQNQFNSQLEQLRKTWGRAAEQAMEQDLRGRQQDTERQRAASRDRLRLVEQQQRELESYRAAISRLLSGCDDLLKQCLRQLQVSR